MGAVTLNKQQAVAWVALDNPGKHNAIDGPMAEQLADAYEEIDRDESIRVAVIRGEGPSFCSGGYIDDYVNGVVGPAGSGHRTQLPKPWPFRKPTIAAIHGYAVGGGFGLALACDLRIAATDAQIGPTGMKRGMLPGGQQIQRLIRLISFSKALEMLLTARYLTGEEAAQIGLVAKAVPEADVVNVAQDYAERIASFSPWTVQTTKAMAYEHLHKSWDDAFAIEEEMMVVSAQRPEALEGFSAFHEKREAKFET